MCRWFAKSSISGVRTLISRTAELAPLARCVPDMKISVRPDNRTGLIEAGYRPDETLSWTISDDRLFLDLGKEYNGKQCKCWKFSVKNEIFGRFKQFPYVICDYLPRYLSGRIPLKVRPDTGPDIFLKCDPTGLDVRWGTGRFGKDVSAKKLETFRQIFHAETSCIILVLFLVFYKLVRSSLLITSL